ncbi:hypothetical protein [Actinocorallia populi]|uniref:hypothetical protein n=1 Tax=Actinocorallia populi TaxID=2079200 RepID=UPI000D087E43|nr:hypothetical protein [Actinocorallia populi]
MMTYKGPATLYSSDGEQFLVEAFLRPDGSRSKIEWRGTIVPLGPHPVPHGRYDIRLEDGCAGVLDVMAMTPTHQWQVAGVGGPPWAG